MRKIEDVLRLQAQGFSTRRIALATGVGETTVIEYLRWGGEGGGCVLASARGAGRGGAGAAAVSSASIFEGARIPRSPDWATIHRELKRPGVVSAQFTLTMAACNLARLPRLLAT